MPRQTRRDARYLSTLPAAGGEDRLHGADGVMTRLGPIGRLGRSTATHSEHIAAAGLELQMIHANPSYLRDGARVAQATREQSPVNSTTTEEVER
jgi:hypothetical protein